MKFKDTVTEVTLITENPFNIEQMKKNPTRYKEITVKAEAPKNDAKANKLK